MNMKKEFVLVSAVLLLMSCGPNGVQGNPGAIMVGAQAGGILGSIIGDSGGGRYGNYHGQMWGSLIGTIAGAAIGNAISTSHSTTDNSSVADNRLNNRQSVSGSDENSSDYVPTSKRSVLEIQNLRFIDDNRNQTINTNEESKIIFEVINDTDSPVFNVTPLVEETTGMKHIYISPSACVERIEARDGIRYTAFIHSDNKIREGEAVFRVYAAEQGGKVSNIREFSIKVEP